MQTGWKNRLENWAPEPPPKVWDRLSDELEAKPLFAQKLYDYSTTPPPGSWESVADKMEPVAVTTPVIRMLPRTKWIRYGSVAASFLFAFVLFRQYSQPAPAGRAEKVTAPVSSTLLPIPGKEPPTGDPPGGMHLAADTRLGNRSRFAPNGSPALPQAGSGPVPYARLAKIGDTRFYDVVPANYQIEDPQLERYIVVPVSEDAAIRLPKRLYDLFSCGEVPQPSDCSELIRQFKQKVANPALLTTADFAGVMELVQNVE